MSVRLKGNIYPRQDSPFPVASASPGCQGLSATRLATEFVQGQERRARALLEEVLRQVAEPSRSPLPRSGSVGALIERWITNRKSSLEAQRRRTRQHGCELYAAPQARGVRPPKLRLAQAPQAAGAHSTPESPRGGLLRGGEDGSPRVPDATPGVHRRPWPTSFFNHDPVILKRSDLPAQARARTPPGARGRFFTRAGGRCPRCRPARAGGPAGRSTPSSCSAGSWTSVKRPPAGGATGTRPWRRSARSSVATSFDSRHAHGRAHEDEADPERVPVHPATAEVLTRWKAEGWLRTFGTPPSRTTSSAPLPRGASGRPSSRTTTSRTI